MNSLDEKTTRLLRFAGAFTLCTLTLWACGGGNSSAGPGTITQDQFNSLLAASSFATVEENQAKDEVIIAANTATLNTMKLIGHVPGVTTSTATAYDVRVSAQDITDPTDYGICSNMGQRVSAGVADADGSPTDLFKTCTGNKVAYNSETGAVATVPTMWFTGANCQKGTEIQFEAGVYDRPTLQGGIIFASPMDGSIDWVQPLTHGAAPKKLTSQSVFTGGSCSPDVEQHFGYFIVSNVTDGANGTGVPNSGVPDTYVYN
jgi:hypothetical protein